MRVRLTRLRSTRRDAAAGPALAFAAIEVLLAVALGLAAAQLVWTLVTPVTPIGHWQPAPAQAIDTRVIGSFDPFFRHVGAEPSAVSSAGLLLSGTRVDTVSGRGAAIITAPDGSTASYAVGETIVPGVTLQAVGFDCVTINRNGNSERLFLDQSAGAPPVTPEAALAPRLAADLLVTPRMQGTAITGYRLAPKGSGVAFAAAGLQPGDVLVSVDGSSTIGDPALLVRRLDAGGVRIGVERGGRTVSLTVAGR